MRDPDDINPGSEGRAWDGGPRGYDPDLTVGAGNHFASCYFTNAAPGPASPYPPNYDPAQSNDSHPRRTFDAVPAVPSQVIPGQGNQPANTIYLVWENIGFVPSAWTYSPKQHDNHSINLEAIAYRSDAEMIIGLRSPLSGNANETTGYYAHQNRISGKALYFRVTDLNQFLPAGGWNAVAQGVTGPHELDLGGQGIRSIEWCPQLAGGVGRYLIIGGPANGGPLEKEIFGERFSLYAWTGGPNDVPQLLISDLRRYTVRPEGVDLIVVGGERRVLFVEDRFRATGYATRNAIHWPASILGTVQ